MSKISGYSVGDRHETTGWSGDSLPDVGDHFEWVFVDEYVDHCGDHVETFELWQRQLTFDFMGATT